MKRIDEHPRPGFRRAIGWRIPGVMILALLLAAVPAPTAACPTISLIPAWQRFLAETADAKPQVRAAAMANGFMPRFPDYYRAATDLPRREARLTAWFADPVHLAPRSGALAPADVAAAFPAAATRFSRAFPDFACRSTIEFGISFGEFDGQTRDRDGRDFLLFGTDVIAANHNRASLPVLFDHELFHLYHARHQIGGQGGADDLPSLTDGLWIEGLASYVSHRLNPGAAMADVLWFPRDLDVQVDARRAEIAASLLADIRAGAVTETLYGRYFNAGGNDRGFPPRSGYYLGYRFAEHMAGNRTLADLARIDSGTIRREAIVWLETQAR